MTTFIYIISGISAYVTIGFLCVMFWVRYNMLNVNDLDDKCAIPLVVFLWHICLPIGFLYVIDTRFMAYLRDMQNRYDK